MQTYQVGFRWAVNGNDKNTKVVSLHALPGAVHRHLGGDHDTRFVFMSGASVELMRSTSSLWSFRVQGDYNIGPDRGVAVLAVAGGSPRPLKESQPGDRPVAWSADGRSLWVFRRGEVPSSVYRLDVAIGTRELWKTLAPPDSAGVYSIIEFRITPTGHSYFYSYTTLLSQLYLVRGVK